MQSLQKQEERHNKDNLGEHLAKEDAHKEGLFGREIEAAESISRHHCKEYRKKACPAAYQKAVEEVSPESMLKHNLIVLKGYILG